MKKKLFLVILSVILSVFPAIAKDKIEMKSKDTGVYVFRILKNTAIKLNLS